jgi:hypothetical protein
VARGSTVTYIVRMHNRRRALDAATSIGAGPGYLEVLDP